MNKPIDQEREAFEAAYKAECLARPVPRFDPAVFAMDAFGEYIVPGAQSAWWGWTKSKARHPAGVAVPDGYALVPVKATTEMIQAALDKPCYDPLGDLLPWSTITRSSYAAMLAAAPHPVIGEQKPKALLDDDAFVDEFMAWWEAEGQLVRSGGGDYERAFAFEAWRHLMPKIVELQTVPAAQDVAGLVKVLADARQVLATALQASAPDWFKTEADIASHHTIERMDAAIAAQRAQHGAQKPSPAFVVSLPVPVKPEQPDWATDDSWMDDYNVRVRVLAECARAIEAAGGQVMRGEQP